MSPASIIVSPLGDTILLSSFTTAPKATSFGNFVFLSGLPIIEEDFNASNDITSPNSSIIECTCSMWPLLTSCNIEDAVKLGGLTTPSRSSELKSGIKTGKFIRATVCEAPDLLDNKEDSMLTSSLFVAAIYVSPCPNLASKIISGLKSPLK